MHSLIKTKVDSSQFYAEMSNKMEREDVMALIPQQSEMKQTIQELQAIETEKLIKTVQGMTKTLDIKIVKLRNDVNLPKLNRVLK